MNDVKRWEPENTALGYNMRPCDDGSFVLADIYDRDVIALSERNDALEFQAAHNYEVSQLLLAERDELRVHVEAMRALLADARRYVDRAWPDGVHSYRTNSISGDLLGKIDAALQAKP